ncbi:EpsG family protein [Bergeyella porcorum]|uniref:EpsG family protein n=1 Tax=Bergeyella porcorum TaxID=1735111 RepID=UPI0035EF5DF9
MEVYYTVFIIAFLLCFFDFIHFKIIKLIPYIAFCLFTVGVVGFREVGIDNDGKHYEFMFYFYDRSSLSEIIAGGYGYMERGYVLLNKLVSFLGFDVHTLFMLMAVMTGLTSYYFFYQKSRYVFLSLLFYLSFYFLYRDFTQVRYAFASALCFWVVDFYLNKKYKKSILFFLLAVLFHNSVMIIIPVLLVLILVKNNKIYFLSLLPTIIIGKMINLFPLLLIMGLANDHMMLYLDEDGGGGLMISAVGLIIMILYYLVTANKKEKDFIMDSYFKILSIGVALNFLFIQSAIFQRFTFILFQFAILLLPYTLKELSKKVKMREAFILIYFITACFLLYYGLNMIDENLVRPYKTFIE